MKRSVFDTVDCPLPGKRRRCCCVNSRKSSFASTRPAAGIRDNAGMFLRQHSCDRIKPCSSRRSHRDVSRKPRVGFSSSCGVATATYSSLQPSAEASPFFPTPDGAACSFQPRCSILPWRVVSHQCRNPSADLRSGCSFDGIR